MADEQEQEATAQGRVTGLILPPPDIRAVVDKTATFVARNGRSFERKIAGETASAKFAFLRPSDPYHAYYEHKLRELAAADETPAAAAAVEERPQQQQQEQEQQSDGQQQQQQQNAVTQEAPQQQQQQEGDVVAEKKAVEAATAKVVKKLKEQEQLAPPEEEQFKLKHPAALGALDQEIMYLTAQYTALSGTAFLAGLATREQRNPQFDFLKPTHALFAYFTALVDSYVKVLARADSHMARLEQGMDRMRVLDRCVHKLEWARTEQERRDREAAESDAERLALAQVDWHDFVVVETITLDDAEEEAAAAAAAAAAQAADAKGSDDDMDMDDDSDDDDEPKAEITVVENYVPLSSAPAAPASAQLLTVDGKAVSSAEANEHMRILLMNPKWREETQRHLEKQKESSYAAGTAIADSLRRFATKRADIFASSAEEEARLVQATSTPTPSATLPPPAQQDDMDDGDDDEPPTTAAPPLAPGPSGPPPAQFQPGFLPPPGYPGAPPGVAPGMLPPGVSAPPPGTMTGPPGMLAPGMRPPPMMGPPGVRPPGMMGPPGMGGPPGVPQGPPGGVLPPGFSANGPPGVPSIGGIPGVGQSSEDSEPAAKRQRTETTTLLPEAEFAALHPVRVVCCCGVR